MLQYQWTNAWYNAELLQHIVKNPCYSPVMDTGLPIIYVKQTKLKLTTPKYICQNLSCLGNFSTVLMCLCLGRLYLFFIFFCVSSILLYSESCWSIYLPNPGSGKQLSLLGVSIQPHAVDASSLSPPIVPLFVYLTLPFYIYFSKCCLE